MSLCQQAGTDCGEYATKRTTAGLLVCKRHSKSHTLIPERTSHCMSVIADLPPAIVRVPFPMPRWRDVIKAMTAIMHEHGLKKKDLFGLDALLPTPSETAEWSDDDQSLADRLDRAFAGDKSCLSKFKLYEWIDGEFRLVRPAS